MPADTVRIDRIVAHPECQPRERMDAGVVAEYADDIDGGAALPPLRAKRDGGVFYLYDGFHRLQAYQRAGFDRVPVEWEDGTLLDAREASCAVNAAHGLRRTNADKRNAVRRMFAVMAERGENWNDQEIARRAAVSAMTVGRVRAELAPSLTKLEMAERTVTRNGTTYTQNVGNIGKRAESAAVADRPVVLVDRDSGEILDGAASPPWEPHPESVPTPRTTPVAVVDPEDEEREWLELRLAEAWARLAPLTPAGRRDRVLAWLDRLTIDHDDPELFEAYALVRHLSGGRP